MALAGIMETDCIPLIFGCRGFKTGERRTAFEKRRGEAAGEQSVQSSVIDVLDREGLFLIDIKTYCYIGF